MIRSRLDDTEAALADAYQQLENHRNALRELIERTACATNWNLLTSGTRRYSLAPLAATIPPVGGCLFRTAERYPRPPEVENRASLYTQPGFAARLGGTPTPSPDLYF